MIKQSSSLYNTDHNYNYFSRLDMLRHPRIDPSRYGSREEYEYHVKRAIYEDEMRERDKQMIEVMTSSSITPGKQIKPPLVPTTDKPLYLNNKLLLTQAV